MWARAPRSCGEPSQATWGQPASAVQVERSSTGSLWATQISGALLRRTAEGRCPHVACGNASAEMPSICQKARSSSSFARTYGSLRLRSGQAPTRPHTVRDVRKFADARLPAAVSIPSSSPARKILRFAVFEVDLAAGELRKNGTRIRLQEQPFQILVHLLDRAGEVVTREELRQKLWPADTFVDFDHSLNTAINKLREALGDSASSPRYVETLARRGYRFLATVEGEANSLAAESAIVAPAAVAPVTSLHRDLAVPLPDRGVIRGLFGLIQIMYLCFYVIALFRLTEIDRVTSTFLPGWGSLAFFATVLVTAGVGIPLRLS